MAIFPACVAVKGDGNCRVMSSEVQSMIASGGNVRCALGCGRNIKQAWACSHPEHGEGAPRNDELFCSKACLETHQLREHGGVLTVKDARKQQRTSSAPAIN